MPISEIVSSLVPNKSPFVWRKERGDSEIKRIFGTETKKQGIFPNAFQNYKQQIAKIFPLEAIPLTGEPQPKLEPELPHVLAVPLAYVEPNAE